MSNEFKPETGAASLRVELSRGSITVYHGSSDEVLGKKTYAREGDWDKLIEVLQRDIGCEWVES